ncbi:ABC transporter substrate-binding protein [Actinomadura rupiterrae]|uniref:ABC transporter substrate-binding protein n=1 Tax=Actinomadura rupiterrae TaxID=559627 RepID=UPI0020A437BA|nr:extracellular solute-binding protein [Actinomadura rupiterrae]MCP2338956.1 ABC-type Fe3+ transport system substrate-binding protein [Actinomadura rupiterrae]
MRLGLHGLGKLSTAVALAAVFGTACGSGDDGAKKAGADAAAAVKGRIANTPALAALVEAARKEGALDLTWGLDGPKTVKNLTAAFNTAYGLNLKVTLTPNQNLPATSAKLGQEYKAKSPASSDAYLGNAELSYGLGPKGTDALAKVDWEKIAPWTKGQANSDGTVLPLLDLLPGFTYNTTLIKPDEVPKTSADVLKLTKPVASTPYAAQFNVLGAKDAMGVDALHTYLRNFKAAGYLGCGELSRIASGEFAGMWISCGKNIGEVFAAQGAPIETAILKDAAIVSTRYAGVPKNSRHPNAAKLFVSWLLTPEAQKLVFAGDHADDSRLPGSRTAQQIKDYEAKGVKFTRADYEFAAGHPDLYSSAFKGQLIKLLTSK